MQVLSRRRFRLSHLIPICQPLEKGKWYRFHMSQGKCLLTYENIQLCMFSLYPLIHRPSLIQEMCAFQGPFWKHSSVLIPEAENERAEKEWRQCRNCNHCVISPCCFWLQINNRCKTKVDSDPCEVGRTGRKCLLLALSWRDLEDSGKWKCKWG